ncbi:tetratricopeptide repeat protein [Novosphingobium clariflavum]|uniref:Tetratricopeptide repeat protein n=1 Tax=Novosphingobium clariflavum TaxID=2029884 RepID=A0ABV6SBN0_9SPHN|nr:hypothetical protein [Novosphingobium clariflavum]
MRQARLLIAALLLVPLLPVGACAAESAPDKAGGSAGADPTIDQIHALATSGHVDQALIRMDRVLKDHPSSAKAHYVEAELYAREDHAAQGRRELARAEQLSPGLPFADVYSVAQLNRQLALGTASAEGIAVAAKPAPPAAPHVPWAMIAGIGAALFGLFLLLRRPLNARQTPSAWQPSAYGGASFGAPGGVSGGMGSGLLGNLVSGAAMGAGFAAGEEAIDHLFAGERSEGRTEPGMHGSDVGGSNADLGGSDFGIADDGCWDDSAANNDAW